MILKAVVFIKKNYIIIFIFLIFSVTFVSCNNAQTTTVSTEELEYRLNNDLCSYSVIGIGTHVGSTIVIPLEYNNLPVTAIEKQAFLDCTNIKSVVISNSVKYIGIGAFTGCSELESVEIHGEIEQIENYTFSYCKNLKNIAIPDSVT